MAKKSKKEANVPNLRFPGFEEAWTEKKLGNLLEFKNGINASKEQYGKGIKFINVLDILSNDFITYDRISGSVDVSDSIAKKYPVKYGDILFQRSSETREEVGTANVYLDKDRIATFGGFVIRGRKIGDYDPIFLNKLLKTKAARESITSKSGGSTRYNVGQEILSSITLHFPTLPEQKKIAAFLSIIDDRIQTQNKIIEKLETLIKALKEKLFSGKVRFKSETGQSFAEWELQSIGEIAIKKSSSISANSLDTEFGDFKIYGATGFLKNISFYREEEEYISIVKDGAGVGRLSYCEAKSSVLGTLDIIKCNHATDLKFLYYLLTTIDFTKYTTGSTIPHIYFKDYSAEVRPIPSIDEQNRISGVLSVVDAKISIEKEYLAQLVNQKKYFLDNLFM